MRAPYVVNESHFWTTRIDANADNPKKLWNRCLPYSHVTELLPSNLHWTSPPTGQVGSVFFTEKVLGVRAATKDAALPTFTVYDGPHLRHFEEVSK